MEPRQLVSELTVAARNSGGESPSQVRILSNNNMCGIGVTVAALVLGINVERREGSNPLSRTKILIVWRN